MLRRTRLAATTPRKASDSVAALVRLFMAMIDSLPAAALERAERQPEADCDDGEEEEEVARVDDAALHGVLVIAERQPLEHRGCAGRQEHQQLADRHEEAADGQRHDQRDELI